MMCIDTDFNGCMCIMSCWLYCEDVYDSIAFLFCDDDYQQQKLTIKEFNSLHESLIIQPMISTSRSYANNIRTMSVQHFIYIFFKKINLIVASTNINEGYGRCNTCLLVVLVFSYFGRPYANSGRLKMTVVH